MTRESWLSFDDFFMPDLFFFARKIRSFFCFVIIIPRKKKEVELIYRVLSAVISSRNFPFDNRKGEEEK